VSKFDFHAGADRLGLAAVHQGLQTLLQEIVLLLLDRGLEAEQSLLARDVAPLDDLFDHRRRIARRRLEHPGTIFQARRNVGIGVCTRLAAKVPTTTITNAALPTSAPALLPFRIAPPMIAIRPRTTPMMLRISMAFSRR
jgi:hypothetical protein